MLDTSRIVSAQRSWSLAGFGTAYGLSSRPDTIHRGYGWGRMLDSDFFTEPLVSDFRCNASQATGSAKERTKTRSPLPWH